MRKQKSSAATAALAIVVSLGAPGATAQIEADEVIVTTGFRPQALADSVGSTTVIDAGLVEARGAEHLEAVLGTAANVTMTSGASRGRFVQIRGIGDLEQFVDPKHYPSVGISVDGIDLGGIASAAMLFDVAQIDVARGPQGTRYGASALAGQVDVTTTAPTAVFDAYVDAGIADYGTAMLGFAAGGALTAELTGRIAIQQHRSDGYIGNAYLGSDDSNGYDETSLRAKLRFTPGDATSLDVTALQFDSDNGYDAFSLDNTRTTLSDQPGHDDLSLSALGLTASREFAAGGRFEATVNWLDSEVDYGFDEDWTFVGICDGTACNPGDSFSNTDRYLRARDQTSLDLRWLGETGVAADRGVAYVIGIYVQDRDETLDRDYYGPFASDYAANRTALYGEVDIPLAARFGLTLGYRYEEFDDNYSDSFAFASASDDEFHSGEIALSFDATDNSMLYAVLARGNKPGGVNTEASSVFGLVEPRFQDFLAPRLVFASEELTNLEFGVKSDLVDGRLGLRAAVFRMARDSAQLESWFWDPVNFFWVGILDNADGDNLGAELDIDFAVNASWKLRASLGWLDAEVEALTSFDLDLDDFVVRDGIDQAKSPSWQVYVGSEWSLDDWRLAVDVESRDDQRYGYYHDGMIEGTTLVNASLARSIGATELTLWARNLFDEDYAVHGLYFGNDPRKGYQNERYLQFGEPRLVGLTVRHSF